MAGTGPKTPSSTPEPPSSKGSNAPARAQGSSLGHPDPPTIRSVGSGNGSPRRQGPTALPATGEQLESFELQQSIGAGGMGAVYLALDTRLDRHVALKVLPPEQANDPEVVQRFYQEGRASARLDHESIARVFTIGNDKQYHFIAFEYIEGLTLRQLVEQHGVLPVAEAINYTLQIAGALVHAAERGVVHRDIKPSNIIVTPQGRAKLVDMGLARHFERGGVANDDGLTQSGMTLGTFDYISPEQARDPRGVDVRSDLYSLGCTLFHMLTGRPPFPDGTVLQKLLQHQEDTPPDVRVLNPSVPADLSAIVTRLMAKDRDRRYQTPDQLSRDLLRVAGAIGLRPVGPEGLAWVPARSASSWDRHLFWGLPAAALLLVVGALVWWGQGPEPADGPLVVEALAPIPPKEKRKAESSEPLAISQPAALDPKAAPDPPKPTPRPPRVLSIKADDDLAARMDSAPPGSTLILTDDGPYLLKPPTVATLRDLTLKAGPGAKPVVKVASGRGPILDLSGGRLAAEGLEFVADPAAGVEDSPAIRAEDVDLTLRRCVFRRPGGASAFARGVSSPALDLRATVAAGPGVSTIDACTFGPGLSGISGVGPVRAILRDCAFAASSPAIRLRGQDAGSAASEAPPPAHLWLSHVSILAGDGPAFRFEGPAPVVRLDDSVVAPGAEMPAVLIAADEPEQLDWRGLRNLYGRIGTYLESTANRPEGRPSPSTWDFESWSDGEASPREAGTLPTDARVWAEAEPAAALAGKDPARAFRLGAVDRPSNEVGARRGPSGPVPAPFDPPTIALGPGPKPATPRTNPPKVAAPDPTPPIKDNPPAAMPPAEADPSPADVSPMSVKVDEGGEPMPGPMARKEEDEPAAKVAIPPAKVEEPPKPATPEPDPAPPKPDGKTESDAVRTSAQFLDAVRRAGPRGGTIRLAADAVLSLPACELRGSGRWAIEAEPGDTRPLIRFVPAPAVPGTPATWSALFRLKSGSLQIQGVDLLLGRDDVPERGRWAAVVADAGTDLALSRCTVTIQGEQVRSAVVAVPPSEDVMAVGAAESSAATVRISESILRGGGDLFDVAAGRRLDLEIEDSALASGGSLVHGHGLPRGQVAGPTKVVLRQVTARVSGGLALLESAPGEPELPVAEVIAWDTVLATNPAGDPLFRVEGQDALDGLRDRIRWEGHSVAYHQIDVYRRDQTAQFGALPIRYDLPSWKDAVAAHEADPTHGDARFVRPWAADRSPWTLTRDDVRLDPDSPVRPSGAAPQDLPAAPAEPSR